MKHFQCSGCKLKQFLPAVRGPISPQSLSNRSEQKAAEDESSGGRALTAQINRQKDRWTQGQTLSQRDHQSVTVLWH